uniref:RRM domain-containing protein n=1 Tax=Pseudictyota dubia TaxID=2749911 RepID=A0A7R9ZDQ3_9STRA|mmetsp:Transcript_45293/g.83784  ORF Transcript_45293/g.83784 Transcript_45293/m.83784 type:complete len:331 (+) Transcript_45293:63-1055(+)|eukprot:CAMPEP_0197444970 /NCGR_PEP_ID=MMETSP1175-20131217/10298_1 /TAXON_ID=1003142 /ORGANISM="Triceratium dubium, Strain CCMP147" /LENGTH=330 /DNA_ID=CAMNT_0042975849 /DNA_START=63 /DNA_END=1055 /DNA_ORIENTATION=+
MGTEDSNKSKLKDAILSALRGTDGDSMTVNDLRKEALLSVQGDEDDKDDKKNFKNATKALEKEGVLTLSKDGVAMLTAKGKKEDKRKSSDAEKDGGAEGGKKRKRRKKSSDDDDDDDDQKMEEDEESSPVESSKNKTSRLFVGNLPFKVDEASLNEFLSGKMTHVKWITDINTGKFYGSAFVEMESLQAAADVVKSKNKKELMGRQIKLNFAPAKPGTTWPPEKRESRGNERTGGQARGTGKVPMGEKPDGCLKLFIGNLSYKVDDETIKKFFSNVGSEVKRARFLYHKETNDPKGCGYVEFWSTEACDKAATLNGKNLLGRPIRIDWTD